VHDDPASFVELDDPHFEHEDFIAECDQATNSLTLLFGEGGTTSATTTSTASSPRTTATRRS
jgi:hypothetical protein